MRKGRFTFKKTLGLVESKIIMKVCPQNDKNCTNESNKCYRHVQANESGDWG